ncbi:MAG: AGE family epimerase/isomerase, partial [Defluviitaleaceae bacterium]|nr:AGE family epimerase/isomerase [Defluviitaleaceae bacterium]
MTIEKLRSEMEAEAVGNILPFWMKYDVDGEQGGFYGEISNDLRVRKEAGKALVLNARILWTFSAAYRIFKGREYLATAERAYEYIVKRFIDAEYGGAYWMLDYRGEPANARKQIYGQAFLIYALSEYYMASGAEESLKHAVSIYECIERHAWDGEYGGYFEAYTKDWGLEDDQ